MSVMGEIKVFLVSACAAVISFFMPIGDFMLAMIVLFIVGWGLESFLGLAVSWKYFIILSFIDTLLYVIIMYFCLNSYERGLCLQLVQWFRR